MKAVAMPSGPSLDSQRRSFGLCAGLRPWNPPNFNQCFSARVDQHVSVKLRLCLRILVPGYEWTLMAQ